MRSDSPRAQSYFMPPSPSQSFSYLSLVSVVLGLSEQQLDREITEDGLLTQTIDNLPNAFRSKRA